MLKDASNITVRNNIIKAYGGINSNMGASGLTIVNNTFVGDPAISSPVDHSGISLTSVPGSTIKNNIFYNLTGHIIYILNMPDLSAGKNLAYRSDGEPLLTSNTYSHADDLWGVDPLFISPIDYHLSAGSPAIDAGYAVAVMTDYDGNPRPQGAGYDIGAFEFLTLP
jgi:hypothetical protein